jgi:hypothetical protein
VSNKSKELEQLKLFLSNLMIRTQDEHAKLLSMMKKSIGKTIAFEDVSKILSQVYDAKIEIMELIYEEIQRIQC